MKIIKKILYRARNNLLNYFLAKRKVKQQQPFKKSYKRLLIVANRLPVTCQEDNGRLEYRQSSGGLVSGLNAFLKHLNQDVNSMEYVWIGWTGSTIAESNQETVRKNLKQQYNSVPVFLSEVQMNEFYNGFCNKIIWPLFHYFPAYTEFKEEYWQQYQKINQIFADSVREIYQPGDLIWIHDYHLMLLPKLLRNKIPEANIGFFLHIPFPFYELFRLLPGGWREGILQGLLGSDLIGFHTHNYLQYFLSCVLRIIGLEHVTGQLDLGERIVSTESFPMGIDYQAFADYAKGQAAVSDKEKIKQLFPDKKIILSLDRLDYTKGIYQRLQGFERFLEKYPEWQNRIILMMVIIPSRVGVEFYQQMKKQLDEEIGKFNGKYSALDWTPIVYQYKNISFAELVPLYSAADICLVTPLRDGMNLVAKEYIACRTDQTGVLILSEMAGAARELGEAIIVNPNNIEEMAGALQEALRMSDEEQIKRNQFMQYRLSRYNVVRWAQDFLEKLTLQRAKQTEKIRSLTGNDQKTIVQNYFCARKKIIFLDYDGTLVPFAKDPLLASPGQDLLKLLKDLSAQPQTELVIISGREKNVLNKWVGTLPVTLVAEHGVWLKKYQKDWKLFKPLANNWKSKILPLLEKYTDALPGSFIEEKDYSLSWHFRMADPEQCAIRKKELIDDLVNFTANIDLVVVHGEKVIEVRNSNINKGLAVLEILQHSGHDFILCIGDDATDEDMFKVLPADSFSIKVGLTKTNAKYNLKNYLEVRQLLNKLVV